MYLCIPAEILMRSSTKPRSFLTSGGIVACDMKQGILIEDTTLPKLTVTVNNSVSLHITLDISTSPVVKLIILPPDFA